MVFFASLFLRMPRKNKDPKNSSALFFKGYGEGNWFQRCGSHFRNLFLFDLRPKILSKENGINWKIIWWITEPHLGFLFQMIFSYIFFYFRVITAENSPRKQLGRNLFFWKPFSTTIRRWHNPKKSNLWNLWNFFNARWFSSPSSSKVMDIRPSFPVVFVLGAPGVGVGGGWRVYSKRIRSIRKFDELILQLLLIEGIPNKHLGSPSISGTKNGGTHLYKLYVRHMSGKTHSQNSLLWFSTSI